MSFLNRCAKYQQRFWVFVVLALCISGDQQVLWFWIASPTKCDDTWVLRPQFDTNGCSCHLAWSITRIPMTFSPLSLTVFCEEEGRGHWVFLPVWPYFQYISGRGKMQRMFLSTWPGNDSSLVLPVFTDPLLDLTVPRVIPPLPPPPYSTPLGGAVMCWSGRKAFFDFCIISCSVQSTLPDFPSIPVLICCPNLSLYLRRKMCFYWDAVKRKMGYLQFPDKNGKWLSQSWCKWMMLAPQVTIKV